MLAMYVCSTILIEPGCTATITKYGDVQIQIGDSKPHQIGTELDTIQLSIFSHRFMSTAEQMGRYGISLMQGLPVLRDFLFTVSESCKEHPSLLISRYV